MRLAWSSLLLLPLFCGLGCESADNCGPTSEWPTCNNDTSKGSESDDDSKGSDPSAPRPVTDGPKRDAGKKPSFDLDAGAAVPPALPADDSSDEGSQAVDAGAGLDASPTFDASVPYDARVPSIDSGTPNDHCTVDSDRREAGVCFGVYCGVHQSELKSVEHAGSCLGPQDLALACDGELTRAVSECAQAGVLSLGFAHTVALCALHKPSLAKASADCVNCYVDEVLCALEHCLEPCLREAAECTSCRRAHCADDFSFCSGLPR